MTNKKQANPDPSRGLRSLVITTQKPSAYGVTTSGTVIEWEIEPEVPVIVMP